MDQIRFLKRQLVKHFKLKDFFYDFLNKSLLIKCFTLIFIISLIFFAWFFFVFDKLSNKIDQINNEIVILKQNKILLDKLIKQKSQNIQIVSKLKEQIKNKFTNDLDLNKILFAANAAGLELLNYGLRADDKKFESLCNQIPLSFKGTFQQILQFLTKIFDNKKLFKFEKININKLEGNQLKFDCIIDCIDNNEFI